MQGKKWQRGKHLTAVTVTNCQNQTKYTHVVHAFPRRSLLVFFVCLLSTIGSLKRDCKCATIGCLFTQRLSSRGWYINWCHDYFFCVLPFNNVRLCGNKAVASYFKLLYQIFTNWFMLNCPRIALNKVKEWKKSNIYLIFDTCYVFIHPTSSIFYTKYLVVR